MKHIAVFFGGKSTEHDVSIVTAISSVIKPLSLSKQYTVVPVYVAKDGAWYSDKKLLDIKTFTSGSIDTWLQSAKPVSVSFDGGLQIITNKGVGKRSKTRIDVLFPALHGTYGEDGSFQGLARMAGIPYVGCGLDASVLAMDKVLAKIMAADSGIATSPMVHANIKQYNQDPQAFEKLCEKQLTYPLFVKPAHLGSSIGISRVTNANELANALEVAFHYDNSVLVEQAIPNLIEVTLPIMGNDSPKPALLERPLTTAEDFFDFDTKYIKGGGKKGAKGAQGYSELPAKLDKTLYAKAEKLGLAVYAALGCQGTARVDMLIDSKTSKVYFNEVNPMPGDLYAHNWRAAGVSSVSLVESLISLAIERHASEATQNTVFSTNYLQQF